MCVGNAALVAHGAAIEDVGDRKHCGIIGVWLSAMAIAHAGKSGYFSMGQSGRTGGSPGRNH
jgi:hypothetical protein